VCRLIGASLPRAGLHKDRQGLMISISMASKDSISVVIGPLLKPPSQSGCRNDLEHQAGPLPSPKSCRPLAFPYGVVKP
jgi:hypothetical protein